jgi:hypothetical protein
MVSALVLAFFAEVIGHAGVRLPPGSSSASHWSSMSTSGPHRRGSGADRIDPANPRARRSLPRCRPAAELADVHRQPAAELADVQQVGQDPELADRRRAVVARPRPPATRRREQLAVARPRPPLWSTPAPRATRRAAVTAAGMRAAGPRVAADRAPGPRVVADRELVQLVD